MCASDSTTTNSSTLEGRTPSLTCSIDLILGYMIHRNAFILEAHAHERKVVFTCEQFHRQFIPLRQFYTTDVKLRAAQQRYHSTGGVCAAVLDHLE